MISNDSEPSQMATSTLTSLADHEEPHDVAVALVLLCGGML